MDIIVMIKFFSRIIAAIGNVISTGVRILKKLAGTRGQRVRYGEELPPRTDSITPPPPPPRLDGQLPQPLPGGRGKCSQGKPARDQEAQYTATIKKYLNKNPNHRRKTT